MTPKRPAPPAKQPPPLGSATPQALAKALLKPLTPPDPSLRKEGRSEG